MIVKKIIFFTLFVLLKNLYANSFETYNNLLTDLQNFNTIGYRSQENMDLQGQLVRADNECSFAILGKGFFRIYDENANIYYTRCGVFSIDENGKLIIDDTYTLLPELTIDVSRNFSLAIVDNSMNITYEDGSADEAKIELFYPTSQSNNSSDDSIYFFNEVEPIYDSRIYQFVFETSSVNVIETALKMQACLFSLHNEGLISGQEYDFKQLILAELINSFVCWSSRPDTDTRYGIVFRKKHNFGGFLENFLFYLKINS